MTRKGDALSDSPILVLVNLAQLLRVGSKPHGHNYGGDHTASVEFTESISLSLSIYIYTCIYIYIYIAIYIYIYRERERDICLYIYTISIMLTLIHVD